MPMNFQAGSDAGSTDLLPKDLLVWAYLNIRGLEKGKTPNEKTGQVSMYLDVELTVAEDQPFQRRKLWSKIGDPFAPNNSTGYKEMGMAAIKRILEAGRWTPEYGPFDAAKFQNGGYALNDYAELSGLKVAIKIKIEKGTNGYADKNDVAEYLSPNPVSDSFKTYERLLRKEHGGVEPVKAAAPQGGFVFGGATAPLPAVAQGGFGTAPLAQPVVQPVGMFSGGPAPTTTATAAPPSNPDTPTWLAQANGQAR